MMTLYPQIPRPAAQELALRLSRLDNLATEGLVALGHPDAYYTPTGGRRVASNELRDLRESILTLAKRNGYPGGGAEETWARFDKEAAAVMHSTMEISANEAACAGVWEFLTCVLLCDIVRWRFPGGSEGTPPARFLSGRRNTLGRLWWRALILSDPDHIDHYHLLRSLGEDEVVQIMERPFLAGSGPLARAVARELLNASARHNYIPRRHLIREAQKHVRRLASFTSFDALKPGELENIVRNVFDQVAEAATAAKMRVGAHRDE